MTKHILVALVIGLVVGIQTLAVVRIVDRDIENYNRSKVLLMEGR